VRTAEVELGLPNDIPQIQQPDRIAVLKSAEKPVGDIASRKKTIAFALTDPQKRARGGITAFIVEKGTPGFTVGRHGKKTRYMKEFPIERIYRDARVVWIYEGTSEIQKIVIAPFRIIEIRRHPDSFS